MHLFLFVNSWVCHLPQLLSFLALWWQARLLLLETVVQKPLPPPRIYLWLCLRLEHVEVCEWCVLSINIIKLLDLLLSNYNVNSSLLFLWHKFHVFEGGGDYAELTQCIWVVYWVMINTNVVSFVLASESWQDSKSVCLFCFLSHEKTN